MNIYTMDDIKNLQALLETQNIPLFTFEDVTESFLTEQITIYCDYIMCQKPSKWSISLYELGRGKVKNPLLEASGENMRDVLLDSLIWIANHRKKIDEMALDRLLFGTYQYVG